MRVVRENLWLPPDQEAYTIYLVTTNAVINNGRLVMGVGAAKEARDRFPGLAVECADHIRMVLTTLSCANYGCLVIRWPRVKPPASAGVGIFQVKRDWRQPAELYLIAYSASRLQLLSQMYPHYQFRLNFPGIGAGQLGRSDVEPVLRDLPDNVVVCYK